MGFDGVESELELGGDLLTGFGVGEELQHLLFAFGERIVGVAEAVGLDLADVAGNEGFVEYGGKKWLAGGDGADGGDEVRFGGIFEQVAFGAGRDGA